MEFITTDTDIFTKTNIYFLLHTYIEEKKEEVLIYTNSMQNKEDLSKHIETISDYFNQKNITFIYDPSKFEEEKESRTSVNTIKKGTLKADSIVRTLATEPFFVSNGVNDTAYSFAEWTINKERPTIFFLFGKPSTGKSHLASKVAVSLYEKGKNVYFVPSHNFVDELFADYKNNADYIQRFKRIDCLIIDDIQYLNKPHLSTVMDSFFAIMNLLANNKSGKLVVTCDQHPNSLFAFPDRIKTRLMSDYIAEIKPPDENIKEQYVEYNFEKRELSFSDAKDRYEIKKFIVLSSPDIRVTRGLLGLCDIIASQDPPITLHKFISRVPISVPTGSNLLWNLRRLLMEYFGEEEIPDKKTKSLQRTRRKTMMTDSVCYYLLQDILSDKTLRKELNITKNHHSYYLQRGKQAYESVNDDKILMQIRLLLQKGV